MVEWLDKHHDQIAASLAYGSMVLAMILLFMSPFCGLSDPSQAQGTGRWLETSWRSGTVAIVLVLSLCLLNAVTLYRIIKQPETAGNKDELQTMAVCLGILWWSDIWTFVPSVNRRKRVARYMASVPTFRLVQHRPDSPLNKLPSPRNELVIRFANRKGMGRAGKRYWRGYVADYWKETESDGCVLLWDPVAQDDEGGAELLARSFTHLVEFPFMDKLAKVITQTIVLMDIENAFKWKANDELKREIDKLLKVAKNNHTVKGIMQGKYGNYSPDVKKETTLPRTNISRDWLAEEEEEGSQREKAMENTEDGGSGNQKSIELSLDRVLFSLILDESSKHIRKDHERKDGSLSVLKYLSKIPVRLKNDNDKKSWDPVEILQFLKRILEEEQSPDDALSCAVFRVLSTLCHSLKELLATSTQPGEEIGEEDAERDATTNA